MNGFLYFYDFYIEFMFKLQINGVKQLVLN